MRLFAGLLAVLLITLPALADQPEYINDRQLKKTIEVEAGKFMEAGKTIENNQLQEQLKQRKTTDLAPPRPGTLTRNGEDIYDKVDDGVLIIARMYLCGKCSKPHANCASGFVVSKDGLAVTNHHVMQNADEKTLTFVAMTRDGRVVPIVEVLAGDEKNDLALVRLADEGKPFSPVPIARKAEVGERVHAVTNPSGRFYTYSSGEISRFFVKPHREGYKRSGSKCVTVTCDYGGGSSGGPIFNDLGQVVAVVSEAAVIPDKKIVHYDSIPYESILNLFKDEKKQARGE